MNNVRFEFRVICMILNGVNEDTTVDDIFYRLIESKRIATIYLNSYDSTALDSITMVLEDHRGEKALPVLEALAATLRNKWS